LQSYRWPGNVRELVNTIERAVSFADGEIIEARDLPEHIRDSVSRTPPPELRRAGTQSQPAIVIPPPGGLPPIAPPVNLTPPPESFESTFKEAKEKWVSSFERDYIITLLKKNNGNISHAARESDIDRKYFRKLMKKYGIDALGEDDGDDD
jgi:transcriptional regulator of acetoin/glycerol metabolism